MMVVIRVRTLTPLYTGGVDGVMDRIHETGILGNLRWWYEAIVRGLGGSSCDPSAHEHELTGERLKQFQHLRRQGMGWWEALDQVGICDACKVFGTTGWRRRFRLEVEDNTQPIWSPLDKMLNIRPPGRTRGWYLPPGKMGKLILRFIGEPSVLSLMASLLLFLERWGNLGAKPQLGYGVFQIENRDEVVSWAKGNGKERPGWKWVVLGNQPPSKHLPDLRRFGFFKFQFTASAGWWNRVPGLSRMAYMIQPVVREYRTAPVSPSLKNEWRFHQWKGPRYLEPQIFGALRPQRQRSQIAVSWAFQRDGWWEVRGWVWFASSRWSGDVWSIITDASVWQRVLLTGRGTGTLEAFRKETSQDIAQLLEEAKG